MTIVSDSELGSVESPQLLQAPLADARLLLVFSGVAIVDRHGEAPNDWTRDILLLILNTGSASPAGKTFVHDQAAPLVTPNAMFDDTARHAGFAVDWCRVLPHNALFRDFILVQCSLGVRNKGAWLYRVGYHVTVTGKLHDLHDEGEKPPRDLMIAELRKLQIRQD